MAVTPRTSPVFSRGSSVLDYWLAHAEGLVVEPLGAPVERVVVTRPVGHAESLIVRSRMTRRRREIPAAAVAAVEPAAGTLLLDLPPKRDRHLRERAAARTRAQTARTREHAAHGARWAAPRLAHASRIFARGCRVFAGLVIEGGLVFGHAVERAGDRLERLIEPPRS